MHLDRGGTLLIGLEAISDPDERGMRTVMCILNGQLRPVSVRDRSIASETPSAEKADKANPGHIAAPFAITTPRGGLVSRIAIGAVQQVEGGDLLAVITAAEETPLE